MNKEDNIDTQLEHIKIGQLLMKDDKYFYINYSIDEDRGWTNDINKATIFGEKNNIEAVTYYLDMYDINTENIELLPVKKITQYQLEDF